MKKKTHTNNKIKTNAVNGWMCQQNHRQKNKYQTTKGKSKMNTEVKQKKNGTNDGEVFNLRSTEWIFFLFYSDFAWTFPQYTKSDFGGFFNNLYWFDFYQDLFNDLMWFWIWNFFFIKFFCEYHSMKSILYCFFFFGVQLN